MAVADQAAGSRSFLSQLIWPTVFTLVAAALLISLGVWQLHRLAWKENLLAEIAQRADSPPAPLPPPQDWGALKPQDYDYRHVTASGQYLYQETALVFAPAGPKGAGPGYLLLTPLQLASGGYVIVNRGYVPSDLAPKLRAAGKTGAISVIGLMRPPQDRSPFTPPDHPEKNEYFTRDPAVIAGYFHLAPSAPFIVDADKVAEAPNWPVGGMTERDIPNNHLGYAMTWFGLAVGLFGVFVAFVVRKYRDMGSAASL